MAEAQQTAGSSWPLSRTMSANAINQRVTRPFLPKCPGIPQDFSALTGQADRANPDPCEYPIFSPFNSAGVPSNLVGPGLRISCVW